MFTVVFAGEGRFGCSIFFCLIGGPCPDRRTPLMAECYDSYSLGVVVIGSIKAGCRCNFCCVDCMSRFIAGGCCSNRCYCRIDSLCMSLISLALIVGNCCSVTICVVASPSEVYKLPIVTECYDSYSLGVTVSNSVKAGSFCYCSSVYCGSCFLAGGCCSSRCYCRSSSLSVRSIILALVVGNCCGVAICVVAGPCEVYKLPIVTQGFDSNGLCLCRKCIVCERRSVSSDSCCLTGCRCCNCIRCSYCLRINV